MWIYIYRCILYDSSLISKLVPSNISLDPSKNALCAGFNHCFFIRKHRPFAAWATSQVTSLEAATPFGASFVERAIGCHWIVR